MKTLPARRHTERGVPDSRRFVTVKQPDDSTIEFPEHPQLQAAGGGKGVKPPDHCVAGDFDDPIDELYLYLATLKSSLGEIPPGFSDRR
ncbi:MAG: hypothetical protein KDA88_22415 [Planctomycetaceae bacterium]|nr:hypothetical protein [Planctomycetaceae bacterium]MCB9952128.1 hypothetical protein [Planctomycetaceae bacterium]